MIGWNLAGLSLSTAALSAAPVPWPLSAQVKIEAPPVSMIGPEFFNPTYTDHRSDATCAGARISLQWHYRATGLAVTALTFDGRQGSRSELARINGWITRLRGDALVRIECGNEGAILSFIDSARAGAPAPTVQISWLNNRAELMGYARFE